MENEFNLAEWRKAWLRRRGPALLAFALVLLLSIAYAIFAKATYRSSATILIEQQEIPQDLVRSTVTSFADQRIQMTIQRVMTFPKLSELITKHNLYANRRQSEPLEVVVEQMRRDVFHEMISADVVDPRSGRPMEATIAFKIAYENHDPKVAQTIANELTSLFLNDNIRNRTQMAESTESFLAGEVERLEEKSKALEAALATFKEKNLRKLPQLTNLNLRMLENSEKEYNELDATIKSLEEQQLYLRAQLSQQSPQSSVLGDASSGKIMNKDAQARFLQNSYISLRAKYSEQHPDVIKARRELDRLMENGGIPNDGRFIAQQIELTSARLNQARQKYGEQHPDVVKLKTVLAALKNKKTPISAPKIENADNPVYVQLATNLESVTARLAHTRKTQQQVKRKWDSLEKSIVDAPKIEQEYLSLTRDYDNTVAKYRELKEKQLQARLAMTLEEERKSERFTLIEQPLMPQRPEKPNRLLIAAGGTFMAFIVGIGLVVMLELLDQTVRTEAYLQKVTGARPLAVVPHIATLQERQQHKRSRYTVAAIGIFCLIVAILAVHLLITPLDVLWYQLLRKMS